MGTQNIDKANIDNLCALWIAMGATPLPAPLPPGLRLCESWPHRCWLDGDATDQEVATLLTHIDHLPQRGIVPVWPRLHGGAERLEAALVDHGYTVRAALTAMALDLEGAAGVGEEDDKTETVNTPEGLDAWTAICSQAFGYSIDGEVVHRLAADSRAVFFLAHADGEGAATALTFQTGDTIGIHQVGVPKAFRGRGIAQRLMAHVMAHCHASGSRYVTLQASAAGEGIYRKIGFEAQFAVRNYQRVVG